MSSRGYSWILAATLLVLGLGIARAQTPVRANIPFDFSAGDKTLPAGTYVFWNALPHNDAQYAIGDGRGHSALAMANSVDWRSSGSKVVFRKYGESYFLSDVFTPSGQTHFAISRAEKKFVQTAGAETITVPIGN
jgi:hypothetical protein